MLSINESYVWRPFLKFNVVKINVGGAWASTTSDHVTIPVAGVYYVSLDFTSCVYKVINFILNVNGNAEFSPIMLVHSPDALTRGQAGVLRLAAGNTLSITSFNTSSNCYTGNPLYLSFSGFLLGFT